MTQVMTTTTHTPQFTSPTNFCVSLTNPSRRLAYLCPLYGNGYYVHTTTSQYPELPVTSPLQANLVSTPPPLLGGGGGEYNHDNKYDDKYDNAEDGKGSRGGADDPTTMVTTLSAAWGLGVEDVDPQPTRRLHRQQQ